MLRITKIQFSTFSTFRKSGAKQLNQKTIIQKFRVILLHFSYKVVKSELRQGYFAPLFLKVDYMIEWKWTKGAPYAKSKRPTKNSHNNQNQNIGDLDLGNQEVYNDIEKNTKNAENSAYSISLNHDENTWDILNQGLYSNDFRQSSKREDLDNKISGRELVQQCGYNPFMENNYADDISQFLQPQNSTLSTFEKVEQNFP